MGSRLPPFNSTGNPPLNLVFIDACKAAVHNSLAEAFLIPFGNAYNPPYSCEDQALVGFSYNVQLGMSQACGEAFWGASEDGWDVDKARRLLYEAYDELKPADRRDLMHVWGDWATRLKAVYTGQTGQEKNWYSAY